MWGALSLERVHAMSYTRRYPARLYHNNSDLSYTTTCLCVSAFPALCVGSLDIASGVVDLWKCALG